MTPAIGDDVLVIGVTSGNVEGSGKVVSRGGLFSITLTKTSSFNGTPLTLQFQQRGSRYDLLIGGDPADFEFLGGLVPRRVNVTVDIGQFLGDGFGGDGDSGDDGGSGGDGGSNGGGSNDDDEPADSLDFDVNQDGIVDQLDIEVVKGVVAGRLVNNRADVNGDRLINTRDIIAIIKAVNIAERERRRAAAKSATTHR